MNKYDNLAKAIYDIGKLVFTAIVVGQIISEKLDWKYILGGTIFTIISFYIAFKINQRHK